MMIVYNVRDAFSFLFVYFYCVHFLKNHCAIWNLEHFGLILYPSNDVDKLIIINIMFSDLFSFFFNSI